jgi:hypothetical protein
MICFCCGASLEGGARFCGRCGTAAPAAPAASGFGRGLRVLVVLALSLLAVVVSLVLLLLSPGLFFRLLSVGGTVAMVLSVLAMVLTARKAKAVTPRALVVSMAISLLSVFAYAVVLGLRLGAGVWMGGLVCGTLIGAGWALPTRLRLEGGIVKREGGWLYLAVWGLFFAFSQLFVAATGRAPALAMLPLLLGTGVVVGQSSTLLWSCRRLQRQARGISAVFLGLALALSSPARAGEGTDRSPDPRILDERVTATLADAARALGWAAPVRSSQLGWALQPAPDERSLVVEVPGCPPPNCTPQRVSIAFYQWIQVWKPGTFTPPTRGECRDDQRLIQLHGMPGCVTPSAGASVDSVIWGFQHDGRTLLAFSAFQSHCYGANSDMIRRGLCDVSSDNALALAEALHQAAVHNGLYDSVVPQGGTIQPAAPPTPPPVAVPEAAPWLLPEPQVPTPSPEERPQAPQTARRATRVAPPVEAGDAGPVPPEEPSEPEPEAPAPTPAETAAATVASGLLVGIGAWLFGKANGVGLGQLAGDVASPPEPPRVPFEEPAHHDGEVKADTGEVWSAEDGGWVSENQYGLERQRREWLGRKAVEDRASARAPEPGEGDVARQIFEGDRRIEARRRAIEERQEEIAREEKKIQETEERLGLDPEGLALQDKFLEHHGALLQQGYRIVNPGYDASFPVRQLVDGSVVVARVTGAPGVAVPNFKPVRCGELANLGIEGAGGYVRELYGDEADRVIVDKVWAR